MEKEITCTVCPMGCQILVSGEGERVDRVEGFSCRRGEEYARNEFTHPVRILTTTVALQNAAQALLPVRSSVPVPKELIPECIRLLREITVSAPVKCHDVIAADILGTGADIIASDSAERL